MTRYFAAAAAFTLIATMICACNAELPPNDAPTRSHDPRGVSDTGNRESASYVNETCRQQKHC